MCSTRADDALVALEAAVDAFAAEDLPVDDAGRLDRTRRLAAVRNRLDAQLTRSVQDAENHQAAEHDGLKTMRSWLRSHLRMADPAARRLLEAGRALQSLPAVATAFTAGQVSADQVTVIAPITTPARLAAAAEQHVDLPEVEATLLTVATTVSHRRLQEAVGFYTRHLDPDGAEPDPTEGRSFTLSRLLGGTWAGQLALDEVGGEKVATAIEAIAAASRCAGDRRTAAQRRGDALVQLADLALASGQLPVLRTQKPHLIVTIGLAELADPAVGPGAARTGLGEVLSAAKARWLACDATITRIVLDPDGLPLDVSRSQRLFPAHIRKAVVERDRSCVFAGCEAPHWWCDVHHLLEWIHGGQTSLDNAALLCERHHTKVHHGFRVERDDGAPPGARWRTYRPDGTEILIAPPLAAA